jgi:hypothetical protein
MREALQNLQRDGHTEASRSRMFSLQEYSETMGLAEVEAWERRFSES